MKLNRTATMICVATLSAAGIVLAATTPGLAGTPDEKIVPVDNDLTAKIVPSPTPGAAAQAGDAAGDVPNVVFAPKKAVVQPVEDRDRETADGDDDDGYASLRAAVADQDMPISMDQELRCLATGVYFESKGEPLAGQLAVAKVILNRAKSHRFPKSVCAVLLQPHQFSFVRGGRLPAVNTSRRAWRTAVAVAQVAINDDWKSPTPGALFFHATYVSPRWRLAKIGTIGRHIFYR